MSGINLKRLVFVLILALFVSSGSGCWLLPAIGNSPSPIPPSPEPAPATPSPPEPAVPASSDWTLLPAEGQGSFLPDFISVVAKIKPSVVAINTETVVYDFFNRPTTREGAGSGWIIDEEGYVVTNNHVVENAERITVTLDDERTFPARVVGTDALADMAVIKIEAENLVKAEIGDSTELKIGEWVLAIGNSLNLGVAPSEGIVRSLGASVEVSAGQTLYGLIGTSAAINPGNSGGPLVNMRGEVVGITTVKIAMVGVEAMGWAISGEVALPIIRELIQKGYVVRPWLGVVVYTVDQFTVLRYNLAVDEGVLVVEVAPGSPADKAGIELRDVVISFNGKKTVTAQELVQAIHSGRIGEEVEITFWRGDTKQTVYATLVESPAP